MSSQLPGDNPAERNAAPTGAITAESLSGTAATSAGVAAAGNVGTIHTGPHTENHAHTHYHLTAASYAGLSLARARTRRAFWLFRALEASVWAPALAMTLGVGGLIQIRTTRGNPQLALEHLAHAPLSMILSILSCVLLIAILLQALRYTVVRISEGVWLPRGLATRVLIWHECSRRKLLEAKLDRMMQRAFRDAKERMNEIGVSPGIVHYLESVALGHHPGVMLSRQEKGVAEGIDWRSFSSPYALAGMDSVVQRLNDFPTQHRIGPTRLGNVLRSLDDAVDGVLAPKTADSQLSEQADIIGQRIDLFCLMNFVLLLLGLLCTIVWPYRPYWSAPVLACVACWTFAYISYAGAVANARAYRAIVRSVALQSLAQSA